jgi:hypothetical protein
MASYDFSSTVGTLLGEIKAESAHLQALIPHASSAFKEFAEVIIARQIPLLDQEFIEIISTPESIYNRHDDKLLISQRRSEWLVWARNQVYTLRYLINSIQEEIQSSKNSRRAKSKAERLQ